MKKRKNKNKLTVFDKEGKKILEVGKLGKNNYGIRRRKPKLTPDTLLLSGDKIFFSVQGEGPTIGIPAIFLRLHLCNLHCGFCDTPYTWNPDLREFREEGESWHIDSVVKEIKKYPCSRLVITGGEPLIQSKAIDNLLLELVRGWVLKLEPSLRFEIETNGTVEPTQRMIDFGVRFNVSPKLENSGNTKLARYHPGILKRFNQLPNTTFKFVVTSKQDIKEIDEIIKECKLDNSKIILMPEGVNMKAITKHSKEVIDLALQRGWRLLPRLQIMLWGNKRGV